MLASELDLEVVNLALMSEPTRAERQNNNDELTVSSTNPSAAGTFTIEDSTGVDATVQASDLQARFGQRTRVELMECRQVYQFMLQQTRQRWRTPYLPGV